MAQPQLIIPTAFILDVDGVLTDGKFIYNAKGKVAKIFGPDDNDGLSLLRDKLHIHFISGDKRGFAITKKRVTDDMGYPLEQVSTFKRLEWMKERFDLSRTIFMGDGIYDALVFPYVYYSISPANGFHITRQHANFVTKSKGGEGAVAEACLHILDRFFEPFDLLSYDFTKGSGAWK